jgi:hypothetical protein
MKKNILLMLLLDMFVPLYLLCQVLPGPGIQPKIAGNISALKDTLERLATHADNEFMKLHFESILAVIESKAELTINDSLFLENLYTALNDESDIWNPKYLNTYLERRRPLILAWESPTDGLISFSWLTPPANWDPEEEYPLYIQLHGLWDEASNSIQYMTYPFRNGSSTSDSFEDGYLLSPWGRGNLWYQGIAETDIWEGMAALDAIVKIDPSRKYLSGHSMGGYGAWHIASRSANTWAALGVHAGALWYNSSTEVSSTVADLLKDLPTYFVCGTNDGLLSINQTAYQLLLDAGNPNIEFVTFVGGHEYMEENVKNMYLWMREFVNDNPTGIDHELQLSIPDPLLLNVYPNPFSNTVIATITLPHEEYVKLEIYNLQGQKIRTLANQNLAAGRHELVLVIGDLPAGIYLCRFRAGNVIENVKIECSK